jgi:hypothetical protein
MLAGATVMKGLGAKHNNTNGDITLQNLLVRRTCDRIASLPHSYVLSVVRITLSLLAFSWEYHFVFSSCQHWKIGITTIRYSAYEVLTSSTQKHNRRDQGSATIRATVTQALRISRPQHNQHSLVVLDLGLQHYLLGSRCCRLQYRRYHESFHKTIEGATLCATLGASV